MENRFGWPNISSRQSPVDFPQMLRERLRPWMNSVIYDSNPACDSILKHDFCEQIWKQHLSGQNQTRLLGVIASLRGVSDLLDKARTKTVHILYQPNEIKQDPQS